jgi:hypothetical protein
MGKDIFVSQKTGTNFITKVLIKKLNVPKNSTEDFVVATINDELRMSGKACKISDFDSMCQVTGIPVSKQLGKKKGICTDLFSCEIIKYPLNNDSYIFALLPKDALDHCDLSRGTSANMESLAKSVLMDIKFQLVDDIIQNKNSWVKDLFKNFQFVKNDLGNHVQFFCNQVEDQLQKGGPIRSEELTKPNIKEKIIKMFRCKKACFRFTWNGSK